MDPKVHQFSGRHCPFCLNPLWQVKATGLEFCPSEPLCDYEAGPKGRQPLTRVEADVRRLAAMRLEVSALYKRQLKLLDGIAALEADPEVLALSTVGGG